MTSDQSPARCRECDSVLFMRNERVADGCPCNSPRGVNHGLVAKNTCTCVECDPEQTGSARVSATRAPNKGGMVSVRMDLGSPDCVCLIDRLDGTCPDCSTFWRHGEIPGKNVDEDVVSRARAKIIRFNLRRKGPTAGPTIEAELSAAQARVYAREHG